MIQALPLENKDLIIKLIVVSYDAFLNVKEYQHTFTPLLLQEAFRVLLGDSQVSRYLLSSIFGYSLPGHLTI